MKRLPPPPLHHNLIGPPLPPFWIQKREQSLPKYGSIHHLFPHLEEDLCAWSILSNKPKFMYILLFHLLVLCSWIHIKLSLSLLRLHSIFSRLFVCFSPSQKFSNIVGHFFNVCTVKMFNFSQLFHVFISNKVNSNTFPSKTS